MYKIYKLVYDNEVIYVGRTIQKLNRRKSVGYKKIPKEIVKESSIELIEETDDISRERYWIAYYKEIGKVLYNIKNGDGFIREYNKEYYEEYYENNKDRIKENSKKWTEDNKEKKIKRGKEYYENNKDRMKNKMKDYYENNKEYFINRNKEYYQKNKEYKKEYYQKNKEYIKEKSLLNYHKNKN